MNHVRTVIAIALTCFLGSCSKREESLTTGKVLSVDQLLLAGRVGDSNYAEVQSSALPYLYDNFRSVLSSQGLVKWDARYDCNHFSSLYVAVSQVKFAVAAWQSESRAQTLALAEVWYTPTGRSLHAIIVAQTELGLLFIEPQTGAQVTLSQTERQSINLVKW